MATLKRLVPNFLTEVAAKFTAPQVKNDKGSVDIPIQPVVVVDQQELILLHSGPITAAGVTAVWTPQLNKSVRVRGFSVIVDPATTSVAGSLLTLTDGGVAVDDFLFLGVAAPGVPLRWQCPLPGDGLLSDAPNNVIGVNLSAALVTGAVYVNVWGVEE